MWRIPQFIQPFGFLIRSTLRFLKESNDAVIMTVDAENNAVIFGNDTELKRVNGDLIGSGESSPPGGSVSEPNTQILYGTGSGVDSDAGLTFDPATAATDAGVFSLDITRAYTSAAMQTYPFAQGLRLTLTSNADVYEGDGIVIDNTTTSSQADGQFSALSGTVSYNGTAMSGSVRAGTLQSFNISGAMNQLDENTALYLSVVTANGSATTDQYGLFIDSVTGATNNYAIKTGAGDIVFGGLSAYDDNAAAVGAGLAVGTLYRTGDAVKIVHA